MEMYFFHSSGGPNVQSQGAGRAVLPLKALREDPSSLLSIWWLQAFLGLWQPSHYYLPLLSHGLLPQLSGVPLFCLFYGHPH